MRRACPADILIKLATDPDFSVRDRVAWNKKAPRAALEVLSADPEYRIREVAQARMDQMSGRAHTSRRPAASDTAGPTTCHLEP